MDGSELRLESISEGALLDCCFEDEETALSAGSDGCIRRWGISLALSLSTLPFPLIFHTWSPVFLLLLLLPLCFLAQCTAFILLVLCNIFRYNLCSGTQDVAGKHGDCIKCIEYSAQTGKWTSILFTIQKCNFPSSQGSIRKA